MTEVVSLSIDSEDLKEFQEKAGMSLSDCVKILINSVKYGGKLELDPFWNEENMAELQRRIEDAKNGKNFVEHDLIEVG